MDSKPKDRATQFGQQPELLKLGTLQATTSMLHASFNMRIMHCILYIFIFRFLSMRYKKPGELWRDKLSDKLAGGNIAWLLGLSVSSILTTGTTMQMSAKKQLMGKESLASIRWKCKTPLSEDSWTGIEYSTRPKTTTPKTTVGAHRRSATLC